MRVVILGNGPAAIAAAETARALDPGCELTLVAKEPVPFYTPCALAEYVEGAVARERLFLRDPDFYRERRLRALLGRRAVAIEPGAPRVHLDSGEVLEFDRLLVATGARAVFPPVPGLAGTPGILALKTLADADAILERLGRSWRAVVLGAGFIGLQAAQALSRLGLRVTVVEAAPQVLPRLLDAELAALVDRRLRAHGIAVKLESPVESVVALPGGVDAVVAAGRAIPCDVVICAAGVRPDLAVVAGSGIATSAGVLVDARMRTSRPGVFAAGDVVEATADDGTARVLANWPNAVNGGRVAGFNLMGVERRLPGLEAINVLRVFDLPVASFGVREGEQTLEHRTAGSVRRIAVSRGRVVGAQFVGDVSGMGILHELMKRGRDVTAYGEDLAEPRFSYGRLLAPPRRRAPLAAAAP